MKKINLKTLEQKQLKKIKAGFQDAQRMAVGSKGICICACAYADSGGSSTSDNNSANAAEGLHS
ncbi:MAG: hypothetical protein KQH79_11025 [Bacteroidetes bacterium]|nr:hypothetical protein [Bacteroidota bacterium]